MLVVQTVCKSSCLIGWSMTSIEGPKGKKSELNDEKAMEVEEGTEEGPGVKFKM